MSPQTITLSQLTHTACMCVRLNSQQKICRVLCLPSPVASRVNLCHLGLAAVSENVATPCCCCKVLLHLMCTTLGKVLARFFLIKLDSAIKSQYNGGSFCPAPLAAGPQDGNDNQWSVFASRQEILAFTG